MIIPSGPTSSNYAIGYIDGLLFVTAPGSGSPANLPEAANPALTPALVTINQFDERFMGTSVEKAGGMVDAFKPQPPPTERQVSRFNSIIDREVRMPAAVCYTCSF